MKNLVCGQRKWKAVQAVQAHIARLQCTQEVACALVEISEATYIRWRDAAVAAGPGNEAAALEPKHRGRCGRKPKARLTDREVQLAKALVIKTGSLTLGVRLAAEGGALAPETADVVLERRKHGRDMTSVIKRQLRTTAEVESLYRGNRQFNLSFQFSPRRNTKLLPNGEEVDLRGGDIIQADDMTHNLAWWVEWPAQDCPCSAKYGVKVTRGQWLPWMDTATLYIRSWQLLARAGESYRGNDIWAGFGFDLMTYGLPRDAVLLEGGIWQGKHVQGIPVDHGHTDFQQRIGGLENLGLQALRSYTPNTKIIENRFATIQKLMGVFPGDLGRHAGEFERSSHLLERCRRGDADPRKYFPHMEKVKEWISGAVAYHNDEEVRGEKYSGVPRLRYMADVASNPLAQLPGSSYYMFARHKAVVSIAKGLVTCRLATQDGSKSYHFTLSPLLSRLGEHFKVACFFDPLALGTTQAALVAADKRTVEVDGRIIKPGDFLGMADLVASVPSFDFAAKAVDGARAGLDRRKQRKEAVAAELYAAGLDGRTQHSVSIRINGAGEGSLKSNLAPMSGGGPAPAAPRPAREIAPAGRRPVRDLNTMSRAEMLKHFEEKAAAEEALH